MIDFSTFFNVFSERILYKNLFDKKEKNRKDRKQPKQVANQDKKIPTISPKAFTFKATKTPNGKIGIKDSKRTNEKPNKKPPRLIKLVQNSIND